jgi:hypothetical protein
VLVFPLQIDDEVLTEMPLYERRERLKKIIKKVEDENASKGDLVVLDPLEVEDGEDPLELEDGEGVLNNLKGKTKFKTGDHAMLLLNESINRGEEGIILKDPMVRHPPDLSDARAVDPYTLSWPVICTCERIQPSCIHTAVLRMEVFTLGVFLASNVASVAAEQIQVRFAGEGRVDEVEVRLP